MIYRVAESDVTQFNRWCLGGWLPRSLVMLLAMAFSFGTAATDAAGASIVGGPYAVLEHGQKGGYEWRVFASPMHRERERGSPCINVSVEPTLRSISSAEVFMSCGKVKPFPTVTQVAQGKGKRRVTVAGMAFDTEVRMVKIPLSDGRAVMRRPRVISARSAQEAHVERFAFLAFSVARGLSIGRVVGYDVEGRLISGLPPK
jgi:hypothetical protein